jgi:hypothetical protein
VQLANDIVRYPTAMADGVVTDDVGHHEIAHAAKASATSRLARTR